jgi:hypothetical protein
MLIWLGLVLLMPSEFGRLLEDADATLDALVTRLFEMLGSSGKEREAAGLALSRLFMRAEWLLRYQGRVVEWMGARVAEASGAVPATVYGSLHCVCMVLKSSNQRAAWVPYVPTWMSWVGALEASVNVDEYPLLRKLQCKLVQRCGYVLLKPSREEEEAAAGLDEVVDRLLVYVRDRDVLPGDGPQSA